MLQVENIYVSSEFVVKRLTSVCAGPYSEKDFNLFPAVSLPISSSCYHYKTGSKSFLLSSEDILFENNYVEFEVTKLPMQQKDITLSIDFTNPENELIHSFRKLQIPASIKKRSLKIEILCQSLQEQGIYKNNLKEQLAIDLINEIIADCSPFIEKIKINPFVIKQIDKAKDFIFQHYYRKINITDIANAVYISTFHFSRLFKKITGMSPYNYLLMVRIEMAKKMLLHGHSITRIALSTGFDSLEHFSHAFARYEKKSPSQFRITKKS